MFSVPLYFLSKPFENIPSYIFKDKTGKRKKMTVFELICTLIFVILMCLQLTDAFGHITMPIPKLWENKCELLLCFTK